MVIWIWTGGRPSDGAKELCKLPGYRRMRVGKAVKANDFVVNWGAHKAAPSYHYDAKTIQSIGAINQASNKLFAFEIFAGKDVSTVPWTANQAVAKQWLAEGRTVVARQTLTGHSGHGIIIIEKDQPLVDAPLYTKYIFKVSEYRVHATRTAIIDTQKKISLPGVQPKQWKIRSHENGFIFARNNIADNAKRDKLAMQCIETLALDFGAVDIIEDKEGQLYVLEVNTAPGLEGQTITNYGAALNVLAVA